jgi:hypothetical protein
VSTLHAVIVESVNIWLFAGKNRFAFFLERFHAFFGISRSKYRPAELFFFGQRFFFAQVLLVFTQ